MHSQSADADLATSMVAAQSSAEQSSAGQRSAAHRRGVASGRGARRWFLVAAPLLAGLFVTMGALGDPAVGQDGRVLYEAYAANPDPLQFKSVGFHFGYAFWIVPAILLAAYVRDRGIWIANVAAFLGWLGISTLPGLLMIDYYDSAIGQVAGVDTTLRVQEVMETMWGVPVIVMPGIVGFVLALPLAAVAAWRAGLVKWWAPVAVICGFLAFMLSGVTPWGTAITTVFFTLFAYSLWRGTRPDRRDRQAVESASGRDGGGLRR